MKWLREPNDHHPLANVYPAVKERRRALQCLKWWEWSLLTSAGDTPERTQALVSDLPLEICFNIQKLFYLGLIIIPLDP